MIKIPLESIAARIREKTGISDKELEERIDKKLTQLSGLITKEGAAHIVANELGVKLLEEVSGRLQIKNVLSGMRDVETVGRVQQVYDAKEFVREGRAGKVASLVIADETGFIRVTLWGSHADSAAKIKVNDITKIVGGYVRENQGRKEIHLNERGQLIINPPNETIAELAKPETARKSIKELSGNEEQIEICGVVVQAFEPRFYDVCPKCNKKVLNSENGFLCSLHGEVSPSASYVMNAILDDGTETIRAVFFREQAARLLKMEANQILKYKDDMAEFENAKVELLGTNVRLIGKVNKNEAFDRVEFIAQRVHFPEPEDEIKRLSH